MTVVAKLGETFSSDFAQHMHAPMRLTEAEARAKLVPFFQHSAVVDMLMTNFAVLKERVTAFVPR